MDYDVADRPALVTGAGRGNGSEIAKVLADSGANVVVKDVDEKPVSRTAKEIHEMGGDATVITADVSDEAEVEAMFEEAEERFGTVDILVNNVGIGEGDRIRNKPDMAVWKKNLAVNLHSAIHCCTHALDGMLKQGYGKIVNITSIHTKNEIGMSPQYDVSKFGVLGLTKTLALELARDGIRVNAVAPGWVDTRLTENFDPQTRDEIINLNPLGRFAQSEEIAHAVAFLYSPASDYINGHELRVDGGQQPIDAWKHRYSDSEAN